MYNAGTSRQSSDALPRPGKEFFLGRYGKVVPLHETAGTGRTGLRVHPRHGGGRGVYAMQHTDRSRYPSECKSFVHTIPERRMDLTRKIISVWEPTWREGTIASCDTPVNSISGTSYFVTSHSTSERLFHPACQRTKEKKGCAHLTVLHIAAILPSLSITTVLLCILLSFSAFFAP